MITCAKCGLVITETKRSPCPRCQSMNRIVTATASDTVRVTDRS